MGFVLGLLASTKVRVILGVVVLIVGWQAVHKGISLFRSVNTASFSTATGSEAYSSLDLTHLTPGANIYMGLAVTDAGSSGFRYGMITTSSGDGVLAKDLVAGVTAVTGGCDAGVYGSGTRLYAERAGLDRVWFTGRTLAGNSTDHLCFHIRLPVKLPSSLSLKSASATFDFTAQPS